MTRPVLLWWGIGAILAAAVLGAALTAAGPDIPSALDTWWNGVMAGVRSDALVAFGTVLDQLGGSRIAIIMGLILVALLFLRRWRAAVFAAVVLVASVLVTQLLKALFGRARPEDILVDSDFGSFPSGHTANAATFAMLAILLLPRLWTVLIAAAWMLAMALSRTVLAAHWLSDTVGGMLVGAGVTLVVAGLMLTWAHRPMEPSRDNG